MALATTHLAKVNAIMTEARCNAGGSTRTAAGADTGYDAHRAAEGLPASDSAAVAATAAPNDEAKRPEIIEHRRKNSRGEEVLVKRYLKGRFLGKVCTSN
jgi:hypothetical protein